MKQEVNSIHQESIEAERCHHYWVIESPRGSTSRGICKFCGKTSEFYNSWPFFLMGKQTGQTKKVAGEDREEVGEDSKPEEV